MEAGGAKLGVRVVGCCRVSGVLCSLGVADAKVKGQPEHLQPHLTTQSPSDTLPVQAADLSALKHFPPRTLPDILSLRDLMKLYAANFPVGLQHQRLIVCKKRCLPPSLDMSYQCRCMSVWASA